jgi:predicted choloylglycine hydrolase
MSSSRLRLLAPLAAILLTPFVFGLAPPEVAVKAKAKPFRYPEGKQGKAELKYVNGIPVLTVEGTPEEIGTAVGTLALKPARRVLDYPEGLLKYFSAGVLWKTAVKKGEEMVRRFPACYRQEMEAMAKASGAARDKVIAGNTLFDIKKMILCSALTVEAGRSATGGPLLGRNLDYPSLGYIQEYSLVTVYRPKGKHAFVSIGFPGLVGCLSGMNDAGLAVGVLEVFGARAGEGRFDSNGLPYALCYRTLLEECTTIAEAKKKLESLPRTTLTNLVVADRKSVGVFEITPKTVVLRTSEGVCPCTNHFCTELRPAERADIAQSYDRFDTLEETRKLPRPVTIEDVRGKLDEVNLGSLTLQTMVFEPATLRVHLATGETPSSAMKLHTLDLAPLLKGK